MKKILISLSLLLPFSVFAQRGFSEPEIINGSKYIHHNTRTISDTLFPKSFTSAFSCNQVIYSASDSIGGYVTGNNGYGDLEKAQKFDLTSYGLFEGMINGIYIGAGKKSLSGNPGFVRCNLFSVSTSGKPDSLLAISDSVSMVAVDTTGNLTYFSFPSPVSIPSDGKFFASLQLPELTGDTLVLVSTNDTCVESSGNSWEKWYNGTWHSLFDSWPIDVDLAIFPQVDHQFSSGIVHQDISKLNMEIFPNPSSNFVNLVFRLSQNSKIEFTISDINGATVFHHEEKDFVEGFNNQMLDISSLPNGVYLVTVASDYERIIRRFTVIH